MINVELIDYQIVIAFFLAFSRNIAIMVQIPLFDNNSVPVVVKILATILFTYAIFPSIQHSLVNDIKLVGIDHFWILTIFQTVIGVTIGLFVKIIMLIFTSAGSIMSQQMGLSAAALFDPSMGQRIGPIERIIQWTILILILSSGALIPMFKGIYQSFFAIHWADVSRLSGITVFYTEVFKSIFNSALLLASPLIFINVLIMSILGIIARTVPQMNVLMVSFVVNIGLGLLVFFALSEEFFHVAFNMYVQKLGEWFKVFV